MGIFRNIILERTGDSRWYIKHTDLFATPEELSAWIKAIENMN